MVDATFTTEMIELLQSLHGKRFKSYEYNKEGRFNRAYGNLRINLGRSAIDISCIQRPVEDFFGEAEDMSVFACKSVAREIPFKPYIEGRVLEFMVDEDITSVELVRDHVNYNDGECVIDMDVALIVRTKFKTYTFSRSIWFDESIEIQIGETGDGPAGLETVEELWGNHASDEEPKFVPKVHRETIVL